MKGRIVKPLLLAEAALCLVLGLALRPAGGAMAEVLSFPFEPLGRTLRALSLSGPAGNILAVVLYVLMCLLPAALLLRRGLRRELRPEDALLGLMSALLFFQMYMMVNPTLLPGVLGMAGAEPMGGAVLGGVFYSLLAAYLLFRFLRLCMTADRELLGRCCQGVLILLAAALILAAFGLGPARLMADIDSLREANSGSGGLGLSCAVLVLGCLADAAVCLLDLWVLDLAGRLLGCWLRSAYSQETVQAAVDLAGRGVKALCAAVLISLGYQLLQLLMMPRLRTVNMEMEIPLFSVALVLAALLLARLMREGKRIKDDNDLFI